MRDWEDRQLLKGTVSFRAEIKGNGLKFPSCTFYPKETGVEKVDVEGQGGNEIHTTVYFHSIASEAEAQSLATKINTTALDRIGFHFGIVIDNARMTITQFSPVTPTPGVLTIGVGDVLILGESLMTVLGTTADNVKSILEQATPPGEINYGLFRSARLATSPVEEFVILYQILLMLVGDRQRDVDTFIVGEEPSVPQTPSPHNSAVIETVYTRLRNELGHRRAGVNLDQTRSEMHERVAGLRNLVEKAIELRS